MMPLRKLQERLQYERTTGARLLLMWAALCWAASLMLPPYTFDSASYHLMADLMGEPEWAVLLLIYAGALCVPDRATMPRWLWTIGVHVAGVVIWGTISVCMLAANGLPSAAVMPNVALAAASCWVLRNAPRCPRAEGGVHG